MAARAVRAVGSGLTQAAPSTTRRAVLWVPDWPVVAALAQAGLTPDTPAAVLHGRGMIAVSAAARAAGVARGMRKRLAQSRCPQLVILPHDEGRDARAFEAVASAAEQVVAGVEITRPGLLMIPAEGAARFHGSEEALAEALVTAVAEHARCESAVGAADGLLAAIVAARQQVIVSPGASAEFLAPLPVDTLALAATERAQRQAVEELVSVLVRLGIFTLQEFTALPAADVVARFGAVGAWARRMALGEDVAPPVLRRQEDDITVEHAFEEPAERVEQLAFVAEQVAQELDAALLAAGMRCSRVRIVATTDRGDSLERVWRTDVGTRANAFAKHMADRVRWQLEGWLSGTAAGPERAPLTSLAVIAEDVIPLGSEQAYLWGGVSGADDRARRALERIQGLLGLEGVLSAREQGGRSPRDRVQLLAWGQEAQPARRIEHPWPGQIPDPAPATVLPVPAPLQVLDAGGSPVTVDRRLRVSAPPTWVRFEADPRDAVAQAAHRHPSSGHVGGDDGPVWDVPQPVEAWAGPWPVVERWWSEDSSRRAYMQIALRGGGGEARGGEAHGAEGRGGGRRDVDRRDVDGRGAGAILAAFTGGRWQLEAVYD